MSFELDRLLGGKPPPQPIQLGPVVIVSGTPAAAPRPPAENGASAGAVDVDVNPEQLRQARIRRGIVVRVMRKPPWTTSDPSIIAPSKLAVKEALQREGLRRSAGIDQEPDEAGAFRDGQWQRDFAVVLSSGPPDDPQKYVRRALRALGKPWKDGSRCEYIFEAREADSRSKYDDRLFESHSDRKKRKRELDERQYEVTKLESEVARKQAHIDLGREEIGGLKQQLATAEAEREEQHRQFLEVHRRQLARIADLQRELKEEHERMRAEHERTLEGERRRWEAEAARRAGEARQAEAAAAASVRLESELRYQNSAWEHEKQRRALAVLNADLEAKSREMQKALADRAQTEQRLREAEAEMARERERAAAAERVAEELEREAARARAQAAAAVQEAVDETQLSRDYARLVQENSRLERAMGAALSQAELQRAAELQGRRQVLANTVHALHLAQVKELKGKESDLAITVQRGALLESVWRIVASPNARRRDFMNAWKRLKVTFEGEEGKDKSGLSADFCFGFFKEALEELFKDPRAGAWARLPALQPWDLDLNARAPAADSREPAPPPAAPAPAPPPPAAGDKKRGAAKAAAGGRGPRRCGPARVEAGEGGEEQERHRWLLMAVGAMMARALVHKFLPQPDNAAPLQIPRELGPLLLHFGGREPRLESLSLPEVLELWGPYVDGETLRTLRRLADGSLPRAAVDDEAWEDWGVDAATAACMGTEALLRRCAQWQLVGARSTYLAALKAGFDDAVRGRRAAGQAALAGLEAPLGQFRSAAELEAAGIAGAASWTAEAVVEALQFEEPWPQGYGHMRRWLVQALRGELPGVEGDDRLDPALFARFATGPRAPRLSLDARGSSAGRATAGGGGRGAAADPGDAAEARGARVRKGRPPAGRHLRRPPHPPRRRGRRARGRRRLQPQARPGLLDRGLPARVDPCLCVLFIVRER